MEIKNIYDDKDLKVIISPSVACKLCDLGHHIVKIKPRRKESEDEHKSETVFLFEKTEEFMKDFYKVTTK